ncbi:MAG: AMMECR1 domain-containing protein, partial [Cyanobacteria bacterium]|nr:AMMECR1 domain-containing protein [Cyanobacteriota bacterium]
MFKRSQCHRKFTSSTDLPPPSFRKPAGVFVTLSKNGKPRACWGSLFPEQRDVVQSTIITTIGALTKEYRYAPIKQSEIKDLKPQVTLIRGIEPIQTISSINPLRDGLMVRSGAKSGIILPGEVKDAFYQMVQCKLKAGISPGEPFQMYRIK